MNSVRDMKICSAVLITAMALMGVGALALGFRDASPLRGLCVCAVLMFGAWLEWRYMTQFLSKVGPWPIVRMGNDFVINDGRK